MVARPLGSSTHEAWEGTHVQIKNGQGSSDHRAGVLRAPGLRLYQQSAPGWSDAQWFTWLSQYGDFSNDEVPTAVASGNTSPKTITNHRQRKERIDVRDAVSPKAPVLDFTLQTEWAFKNGQVTKMYPANAHCTPTSFGLARGWHCANPDGTKVRANCYGGNPEHCAYTYSFDIYREIWLPIVGTIWRVQEDRWCLTNQISGSGAHYRHGSCDHKAWP